MQSTLNKISDNKIQPYPGYLIEPVTTGKSSSWEGHHATNPCVVRIPGDSRVFLGYRAGGPDDWFMVGEHKAWASYLGLAVLDASGTRVTARMPLPVMKLPSRIPLPKSGDEYEAHQAGPDRDTICVLHDFRFWCDGEWLYVIYHEGTVSEVFDCIVRMRQRDFISRISASLALMEIASNDLEAHWESIWWKQGVWEPAGINGTNRIYGSKIDKNDIVFIRTSGDGIRMLHRPTPDIAILDTNGYTYAPMGSADMAELGAMQTCIRPGLADNSHIGNNGSPVVAQIGDVPVYIDIVHGVFNRNVYDGVEGGGWKLTYLPYLRVIDARDGSVLYYSEKPVLEIEDAWSDYTVEGEWVRNLGHLDAVMFAGGQLEVVPGSNGVDDYFNVYMGVGDTAVALGCFRLCDLIPDEVLQDIQNGAQRKVPFLPYEGTGLDVPHEYCGWKWRIEDAVEKQAVQILRSHQAEAGQFSCSPVSLRPGYFDADCIFLVSQPVQAVGNWAWLVAYNGLRWEWRNEEQVTVSGLGILLLDAVNPERILYRSTSPVTGSVVEMAGWTAVPANLPDTEDLLSLIPARVLSEGQYLHRYTPIRSAATRWLKEKGEKLQQSAM